MAAKSLRDLNQKYRGKPKKYAEGGRARRPAAAPVPRPSDEDYLSILADRAVGAGEPVAELRSSEGRGFAPTPFQGEGFQRMSAMLRGEVEPTPGEQIGLNIVRGFTEGPASIRAYHGSPHRFERFDISKIGTGEGAQAYGHGLYFAESEPVARYYRDTLTRQHGRDNVWRDASGREFDIVRMSDAAEKGEPLGIAASMLRQSKSVQEAIDDVVRYGPDAFSGGQRDYDSALKGLRSLQESGLTLVPGGHMYEVALHAKPRDFLDWELPLSKQAPEVRESLTRFGLRADPDAARAYDDALLKALYSESPVSLPKQPRDPMGQEIYQHSLRMSPEEATRALREAGIPGTRYLDAGSRGVGGSYNYAVFDPEIIDITRRYAEGGLAELDQKYADGGMVREPATAYDPDEIDRIVQEFAEGGEVEAPAKTYIGGQEHKLAYITDREAALLKARGGSGRMTKHGIRAYNDANSDNANSNSEAAAQDAAGGNQGQGAGPTGAGAGGGPPGNDPGPTGEGQSEVNTPGMAPGISTAPTAVGPIGPEDEANAAAAKGAMANAPMGFEGYGIMDAIDAYNSGRMGLAQAIGYGIASVAAPPGFSVGFNVDPQTQTQTPAMSVSVPGVIGGLMGLATGVPGAGMIGGFIGNEIGKELGLDPTVMSYEPGVFNAPEPTPAYGAAGYGMDYGQGYAHGGLAKLRQKYAEGGEVEDDGGVERYDPREIDALASEFMAESNPADLMQRARMMMRGVNVGMPSNVGALNLSDNENVSTYTGLREMPIEDDRFARALRTLNTGINATLDQERGIRLGAGLQALQDAGDRGMSGYGANLSAGYGPVSLHGGYQSQLQAYPGAKPQEFYTYGGNLNIPLDDEGAKALLGAQVMSGRRGSAGAGNAGTLITGGLERPFRGGTLGVDVSVDPTLRNKEILFGYRRAF